MIWWMIRQAVKILKNLIIVDMVDMVDDTAGSKNPGKLEFHIIFNNG